MVGGCQNEGAMTRILIIGLVLGSLAWTAQTLTNNCIRYGDPPCQETP